MGGRLGCLVPLSEKDNSFEPAWSLGGYYRTEPLTATTLMYEVAVDFIASRSDTGEVESSLWMAALDLLWCPWSYWSGAGWSPDFYLFGGGGVLFEASLTEMSEGRLSDTDWTGAINLGLGLASLQKGWNLRATYTLFPGSRNVKSAVSITAGWAFSF